MVEFHPAVWMFDDDFKKIEYSYFKGDEIIEELDNTYADRSVNTTYSTVTWNHSLSEVVNNLIKAGVSITAFEEYDYSPYDCFKNTIKSSEGKYRIKHLSGKLPMVYAIKGKKQ